MALIQTGQAWHFRTESDLEEVLWRNLPELLSLEPLSRQFCIDGKYCDLLAVDALDRLVIIELKNTEDRYIVQQLTRYYDALKNSKALPFAADATQPRLLAISPSFHADTYIDCQYSTLDVELLTFRIDSTIEDLTLVLQDAAGDVLSKLCLSKYSHDQPPEIQLPEPPRKLLNWLSHSAEAEYDWVLRLREQLLTFDPRMKEISSGQSIFYGRGKTKPCCELRKVGSAGYVNKSLAYFLWLPQLQRRPLVRRMMVGFNFGKQQVPGLIYSQRSYRTGKMWDFPKSVQLSKSVGWRQALACYEPFLNPDMTISPSAVVDLALQTWHKRL